jgi:hypothetical protein
LLLICTLFIHCINSHFKHLSWHSITKILRNGPRAHFPFTWFCPSTPRPAPASVTPFPRTPTVIAADKPDRHPPPPPPFHPSPPLLYSSLHPFHPRPCSTDPYVCPFHPCLHSSPLLPCIMGHASSLNAAIHAARLLASSHYLPSLRSTSCHPPTPRCCRAIPAWSPRHEHLHQSTSVRGYMLSADCRARVASHRVRPLSHPSVWVRPSLAHAYERRDATMDTEVVPALAVVDVQFCAAGTTTLAEAKVLSMSGSEGTTGMMEVDVSAFLLSFALCGSTRHAHLAQICSTCEPPPHREGDRCRPLLCLHDLHREKCCHRRPPHLPHISLP